MPSTPSALVIFDCDGTLVDSERLNNAATLSILHSFGLTQYDEEYAMAHFLGRRFTENIRRVAAETGTQFPDNMQGQYVETVRAFTSEMLKPVPHAADAVAACAARAKICVGSNGERANVVDAVHAAGLAPYFPSDCIFTATDVANPKPAPDLFLHAAETMGANPADTLVIEDSPTGVRAGVAAGMRVLGFTGTAHDKEQTAALLRQDGAIAVIDDLRRIAEWM